MDAVLLVLQKLDVVDLFAGYLGFRMAWAVFRIFF